MHKAQTKYNLKEYKEKYGKMCQILKSINTVTILQSPK